MKLLHANDARGVHAPSWYAATCRIGRRPPLEDDVTADVCIVGGGLTGLAAAAALAARGHSVVLLEAHRLGWGASGRNGGQLGSGYNLSQEALERQLGHERAHALYRIAEEVKHDIRALAARHDIDLEYRPGIVTAEHHARTVAALHRDCERLARDYGHDVETLDRAALRALVDSDGYHGGAIDRSAGHLHPLRLVEALAREATAAGAVLHESSEVLRIEGAPDVGSRTDGPPRLVTPTGRVRAERVLLAGNGYLDALAPGTVAARVMPINSFILVTEPLGARAATLLPGNHAVADSRFVVNYFRRTADDRLLFGGGESYGYRFPRDMARRTRRALLGVFPDLAGARVDFSWGGTLAITRNRLPHVRRLSPRLWSAGGYSGHGVGLAVATGQAIGAALDGDPARAELLAALPSAPFPGGPRARPLLLALAMSGAAWLDRL